MMSVHAPTERQGTGKARNEQALLAAAAKSAAGSNTGRAAFSAPMYALDGDHKQVFGHNMARARRLAGHMSQEALAAILGVDRRVVNRWECGHREPRGPMRKRIAEALGQPLDFFYDEAVLDEDTR